MPKTPTRENTVPKSATPTSHSRGLRDRGPCTASPGCFPSDWRTLQLLGDACDKIVAFTLGPRRTATGDGHEGPAHLLADAAVKCEPSRWRELDASDREVALTPKISHFLPLLRVLGW